MNRPFLVATKKFHIQAQKNADYFGFPYVCFFDSSGSYRVERYDAQSSAHRFNATIFYPHKYDDSNVRLLGED